MVLALGSGVGAGLIVGGQLVRGKRGCAGEIGHIPVSLDGPPCVCGGRGCLAVYTAGELIAQEARRRAATEPSSMIALSGGSVDAITTRTVFAAANAGDAVAREMVDRACQALGAGLAIVVNGLDPEVVVLTGGGYGSWCRRPGFER